VEHKSLSPARLARFRWRRDDPNKFCFRQLNNSTAFDVPAAILNWQGTNMQIEILAGRALAMCLHPYATWRARSSKGRAFVVVAYVVGSYVVALGFLFAR
jgi:hypothetical protein